MERGRTDLLQRSAGDIPAEYAEQAHTLLCEAFPDLETLYDYGPGATPQVILLLKDRTVIGHLAAYTRPVLVGRGKLTIGLIGGVAVATCHRLRGHARGLVAKAHAYFRSRSIAFSVLFATDPTVYRSSGYRPMRNVTRFLDTDAAWKEYVYHGGMVAELDNHQWDDAFLDLMGPTV